MENVEINLTAQRFARHLKQRREQRGMTQEGLAKRLGVTRQAISYIETGGGASLDLATRIADVLQTRLSELVRP